MARGIGLALAVCLALAGGAGPAAAKGSADLQWAQQALKDKGFDVGKPTGEMTPKTRAALSSFQRISGLAVTGELDAATTAKLLTGRPEPAGGGMLGVPPPSSHPRQPAADAPPPRPHAAPAARIEALAGPGGEAVISSAGGGVTGAPAPASRAASGGAPVSKASGGAPAPKAAPSGAVSAQATGALPGQAPLAVKDNGDTEGTAAIEAAAWVRDLVVGVIVTIFGGFAVLWWWSGRKPARHHRPARGREQRGGERLEPSFAPPERPRGGRELRVRRL